MSSDTKTGTEAKKERRFPVAIAWIAFLAMVIVGAGFISSPVPGRQVLGFVLLFAPLVIFSLLMALFYWRSRRYAETMAGSDAQDDE